MYIIYIYIYVKIYFFKPIQDISHTCCTSMTVPPFRWPMRSTPRKPGPWAVACAWRGADWRPCWGRCSSRGSWDLRQPGHQGGDQWSNGGCECEFVSY